MGMIKEFKDFAMKVVDLAVAVIIGSLIGQSFDTLTANVNGVAIQYGAFIQAVINFIIIAFVLFMIIKVMNSTKKKEEAAPAATPEDIALLREIRDSLKK